MKDTGITPIYKKNLQGYYVEHRRANSDPVEETKDLKVGLQTEKICH